MTLSSAERQRRYRERLQSGAVVVRVELLPADIEHLVDCGWVTEGEALSHVQLSQALLSSWQQLLLSSPEFKNSDSAVTTLRNSLSPQGKIQS